MRRSLAVLLLAALIATSGCVGSIGDSRPASDREAQDALNRTRAALEEVTAYRARSEGSAIMRGDGREVSATTTGEVVVNVSSREMNSTGRLDDPSTPLPGVRRTYVNGYTAVTECRLAGWGQRNLSTSRDWFAYTPIGEQLAVLALTPVYWAGTERLDGTETAVIEAHPTKRELVSGPGLWTMQPDDPDRADLRNATVRLWVSTETWLPRRIDWESTWRAGGARVTLSSTWWFEAYDEPVAISRPSIPASDLREHGC